MPWTGAWNARRSLALVGNILFWLIVVIDVWYIWPTTLGGKTSFVVVSGHSMEPTYFGGDLVIAREMEPSVGDVIVYAPNELGGSQIVHRIIGGSAEEGWVLQGDNNTFIDPFEPKADEVKGVVLVHYSDLGRLTALLLNPIFWASFILAALVIFVWFSGDDCDDDEDEDDDESASGADPDPDAAAGADVADAEPAEPSEEPAPVPAKASRAKQVAPVARATAFLAAAAMTLGIGVSPAAAAQLVIGANLDPQVFAANACGDPAPAWTSTTTATGTTSNQVTVGNIPAGCRNKVVTVYVHNSAGAVLATMTGTPAAASHSFTMASGTYTIAQVSRVVVKVEGWNFPTTWTAPVPSGPATCVATDASHNPVPGGTCTVTSVTIVNQWGTPGNRAANTNFRVTSSTGHWVVTFNFSQAPFPGWNPKSVSGNFTLPPLTGCSSLPNVTLRSPGYSQWQQPTHDYFMGISEAPGNVCAS